MKDQVFFLLVKFYPLLSLCCGVLCCVTTTNRNKLIFGNGIRLTIEPSKYCYIGHNYYVSKLSLKAKFCTVKQKLHYNNI